MPSHRARGFGRYVAFRTATPRHAVPTAPRAVAPILLFCALLSLTGLALIGLRLTAAAPPAAAPAAPRPTWAVQPPVPYFPSPAVAHAVRRAAKERPPVLLGTLTSADLTTYCRTTTGPLSELVPAGDGWACHPLFGEDITIRVGAVCRSVHGDDARGNAEGRVWRCYRDAS